MVQHVNFVAQDGQAVQIYRHFLMRHGWDAGLQGSHVPFQNNGDLVPEAVLDPPADKADGPGAGGGERQCQRRDDDQAPVPGQDAITQVLDPEGNQGIREGCQKHQEQGEGQEARLVLNADFEQPPHRRPGGRQWVTRGFHSSRPPPIQGHRQSAWPAG